jgi:hypothetical protein
MKNVIRISEEHKDVTCENCGWSWDIEPEDKHPYLCHQCGHTNKKVQKKVQNENLKYLLQMGRKSILVEQYGDEAELFKLASAYYRKNGKAMTIKVLEKILHTLSKRDEPHRAKSQEFPPSLHLQEQVVQGDAGDPYEYKKEGGYYYARKKGAKDWILTRGNMASAVSKKFTSSKVNISSPKPYTMKTDDSVRYQRDTNEPIRQNVNKQSQIQRDVSNKLIKNSQWINKASKQVQNQIKYLIGKQILEPFTILDDINSKVYAVNSDYTLYNTYNVITGRDRGDEVKSVTFTDWFLQNPADNLWKSIKTWWNQDLQTAVNKLDSAFFNTKLWSLKNTPSGIFKAEMGVSNWLKDKALTAFAEKDYGKKFIGFETLGGQELAIGFHGTKNLERINIDKDDWTNITTKKKGNMSFGCINFKDADIQNISQFMKSGQYSFWLPDENTNIVKFP